KGKRPPSLSSTQSELKDAQVTPVGDQTNPSTRWAPSYRGRLRYFAQFTRNSIVARQNCDTSSWQSSLSSHLTRKITRSSGNGERRPARPAPSPPATFHRTITAGVFRSSVDVGFPHRGPTPTLRNLRGVSGSSLGPFSRINDLNFEYGRHVYSANLICVKGSGEDYHAIASF
ncbi:hypothetical protein GWI33_011581, partial [Rhynchophorus ferrugineus]